ncbi:MAG: hypothetical protein Q9M24_08515 [Mariprofundaceae bacterium]|nr:hypothetical protein [Mariprofundaceae bacterium]
MDTYRNIESLFSDYFADDVGPAMRYASLRKMDAEKRAVEKQPMEKQMVHVWDQAMVREENNGNKD